MKPKRILGYLVCFLLAIIPAMLLSQGVMYLIEPASFHFNNSLGHVYGQLFSTLPLSALAFLIDPINLIITIIVTMVIDDIWRRIVISRQKV